MEHAIITSNQQQQQQTTREKILGLNSSDLQGFVKALIPTTTAAASKVTFFIRRKYMWAFIQGSHFTFILCTFTRIMSEYLHKFRF